MEQIGVWGATSGGGSGIGRAVVERLSGWPDSAVHVFGRSEAKLADLRAAVKAVKGSMVWDLSEDGKAEEYQRYLSSNGIRTVVNAVGMGIGNPLPLLSQPELRKMVDSNLLAPGFQTVSVHGVYSGSVSRIRMESVVEAVCYLARLPEGVHADVVVN